jgi:ABC-2 type transport system permease protein
VVLHMLASILNQTIIETKIYFRYRVFMFWTFVFPILFLLIFSVERESLSFIFPGVVVMALLTTCVNNTVAMVVSERRADIYKRLQVTPLRRSTLIAAKLLNRCLVVVIQMALLFAVAAGLFGIYPHGGWLELALLLTLSALCFLAIAFFISGIVRDEHTANIVSMTVFFTLSVGSNTFFSMSRYPVDIQPIVAALPTTLLATTLRQLMAARVDVMSMWPPLAWIGVYGLIFVGLSIKFFRWSN